MYAVSGQWLGMGQRPFFRAQSVVGIFSTRSLYLGEVGLCRMPPSNHKAKYQKSPICCAPFSELCMYIQDPARQEVVPRTFTSAARCSTTKYLFNQQLDPERS